MRISDRGIILFSKKLQEKLLMIKIFSAENGLCFGIVKNIAQKRMLDCQVGNFVQFERYSRLSDQLGVITCERVKSLHGSIMSDKLKLHGFNSMSALILNSFMEFESHIISYKAMENFIDNLIPKNFSWLNYCLLELEILTDAGYRLELEACAVTRETDNLMYVSPKTGRAVSRKAAIGYEERLLKLPNFLIKKIEPVKYEELEQAFILSGYFFERYVWQHKRSTDVLQARNFLKSLFSSRSMA